MKRYCFTAILLLMAHVLCAFNPEEKRLDMGLSAGLLGSGSFEGSWYDDFAPEYTVKETNEPAFMGRAVIDYFILPYLGVGLSLVYAAITLKEDLNWYDDGMYHVGKNDIFILDYCLGIKGRLAMGESFAVKPGIYFGCRNSFSHSREAREIGLAIDGSVEVQYFINDNFFTYVDIGFLSQPYGGVQDIAYVRGGPIYYIAAGFGI